MSYLDLKLSVTNGRLQLEAISFKGGIWLLCNVPAAWSEAEERAVPVTVHVSECRQLCARALKAGLQVVAKSETASSRGRSDLGEELISDLSGRCS